MSVISCVFALRLLLCEAGILLLDGDSVMERLTVTKEFVGFGFIAESFEPDNVSGIPLVKNLFRLACVFALSFLSFSIGSGPLIDDAVFVGLAGFSSPPSHHE